MNPQELKKAIQKKKDPEGYILSELLDMQEAISGLVKKVEDLIKTAPEEIVKKTLALIKPPKNGQDGKTPTDEKLLSLIKPLIPKVKNGETPTDEKLLSLIKPLLTEAVTGIKAKDGETPTDTYLIGLMTPIVQQIVFDLEKKEVETEPADDDSEMQDKIDELDKEVKLLKKNVRAVGSSKGEGYVKGGGMGNWIHETFATDSTTTSVTLKNRVAANSTAILVRYNGQLLFHGVQYTISNHIISFTFTLDNSSTVDVTYVRT